MLNSVIKYLGMDFQGFVNTFSSSCAVLSVEKGIKGHSGKIRIVKANDFYKGTMGVARYHDGMIYSDLVPQNLNFEDFCYRCVLKRKSFIHTLKPGIFAAGRKLHCFLWRVAMIH